jgi:aryl sulfotransferase
MGKRKENNLYRSAEAAATGRQTAKSTQLYNLPTGVFMNRSYAAENLHIFQSGLPKSGNLFLYKIIKNSVLESDVPYKSHILTHPVRDYVLTLPDPDHDEQANLDTLITDIYGYLYGISPCFKERIYNLYEYIHKCTLIWSHDGITPALLPVLGLFNKTVYIIRDPRDVLISWARWCYTPYCLRYYLEATYGALSPTDFVFRHLTMIMMMWIRHVTGFLLLKDRAHFVFYERLVHDFENEFGALLKYLELELSEESRCRVREITGYENMKKYNQNHLRSGTSGQWKKLLAKKLKKQAISVAGLLLETLNYPLADEDGSSLPSVPARFTRYDYNNIVRPLKEKKLWARIGVEFSSAFIQLR